MRIFGRLPRSGDLDELIAQLGEGPTPFDAAPGGGKAPDAPAHPVGQGQAGYSATEPLGTKHVGECLALVLRDPATGTVACAHIDQFNTPASIQGLFEALGPGPREAMLLGAMYAPGNHDAHPDRRDASRHNLSKVLGVLAGQDVNIVAAQVQDADQPSSLYIDPRTMAVRETAPEHPDPDFILSYAKMMLTGGRDSIPLDTVFDLRGASDRRPIPLRAQEIAALDAHVEGRSDAEIGDWFRSRPGFRDVGNWIATCVDLAKNWNDEYRKTLAGTAEALGRDPDELRGRPMFVGANAAAHNAALHAPRPQTPRPQKQDAAQKAASEMKNKNG